VEHRIAPGDSHLERLWFGEIALYNFNIKTFKVPLVTCGA
jgi:hypothetical protein